ncbi:galactose-binding domain-like protein [Thamnocephalis sphaerospora]|uniref:Galactose-binding domain-like protein n=1 Tax=Thamnocephalis sphaerospora TaxID=78915 RepID=A0A4V1IXF1_9FUNG|nr:galactose-binding domain-like protein [Thamnocephalis sphaerospora]|eukprot:RKP10839.1 galactose-binding domain-like protein [Thamnocephalis sphaerospora]
MSHCQHEHHEHGHGHGDGHDHTHDEEDALVKDSLYEKIDREHVCGLNESQPGAAKTVIKPWHERRDTTQIVESDADEQLIVTVPFTGMVKLKSILLFGPQDASAPAKLKVYVNRDDIDFDTVDSTQETQAWELAHGAGDVCEYHTRRLAKFSSVRSITLFFSENFGDDVTRLSYIGFRGEWTKIPAQPIITAYELRPNPADHKNILEENTLGATGYSK